jgi:hypothetical protein
MERCEGTKERASASRDECSSQRRALEQIASFLFSSLSLLEAPGVFVVAAVVLKERNGSLLEKFDLSRF